MAEVRGYSEDLLIDPCFGERECYRFDGDPWDWGEAGGPDLVRAARIEGDPGRAEAAEVPREEEGAEGAWAEHVVECDIPHAHLFPQCCAFDCWCLSPNIDIAPSTILAASPEPFEGDCLNCTCESGLHEAVDIISPCLSCGCAEIEPAGDVLNNYRAIAELFADAVPSPSPSPAPTKAVVSSPAHRRRRKGDIHVEGQDSKVCARCELLLPLSAYRKGEGGNPYLMCKGCHAGLANSRAGGWYASIPKTINKSYDNLFKTNSRAGLERTRLHARNEHGWEMSLDDFRSSPDVDGNHFGGVGRQELADRERDLAARDALKELTE